LPNLLKPRAIDIPEPSFYGFLSVFDLQPRHHPWPIQGNPMKNKILAGIITLALACSFAALRAAEAKKDDSKAAPKYSAACPSPCTFSVSGNDKKEVVAKLKEHAKSAHHMDMSDKDAEGMIKEQAPKKS
jgi:predicted small metal-binding protein